MALSIAEIFGIGAVNAVNEEVSRDGSKTPRWLQAITGAASNTLNAIADIELFQFEQEIAAEQRAATEQNAAEQEARRFGVDLSSDQLQTAALAVGAIVLAVIVFKAVK